MTSEGGPDAVSCRPERGSLLFGADESWGNVAKADNRLPIEIGVRQRSGPGCISDRYALDYSLNTLLCATCWNSYVYLRFITIRCTCIQKSHRFRR